jgi:SAM-dependent methyltransferase
MQKANTNTYHFLYWDAFRDLKMGQYLLNREQAFIRNILGTVRHQPRRVLEIGCCSGRVSLPFREAGLNFIGLDIDHFALTMFHHCSNKTPLVRGDALLLPFADGCFDCILAIQCFSYFNHQLFLQESNRVLANDGLLIYSAVNSSNYKRVLKRLRWHNLNFRPTDTISCSQMLLATEEHGFEIQTVSGYNWVPFTPELAPHSNSLLVGLAAWIERTLRLDRYYRISPWILVAAKKRRAQ